jgi:hypothetical protein
MPAMCSAPQNEEACHYEKISGAVEYSVPHCVELEIVYRVHGIPAAQHVMPLQDLMQHDPVKEAAKAADMGNPRGSACGSLAALFTR